jgi:diguanylate cyclase (GGDEF)-like protein/PAS domain S-box-containing protein
MAVILIIIFAIYTWSEKKVDRANDRRHISFLLADELRQSSDDLTRMARLYVVTGNPLYKKYYQSILDIRDGKIPRPEDYQNIYWDFVLADGKPPRPDSGPAIPLLELMRQVGFTPGELHKLAEAKANSDALAVTEFAAMTLAESEGHDAGAGRTRARMMLFGYSYHQAKAAIMRPISEANLMMDQRTRDAVLTTEKYATVWRNIFIAVGLWMIFLLWKSYTILKSTLMGRISDAAIASSINGIAIAGMDGKLSYVNQAFVDMWRLQGPENAVGRSPTEFWEKPEAAHAVMEVLQQQGHWQGELRARRHDGSLADFQLSAHLVMDEAGKPVYMMGSFMDISERKQAEYRTRISEARYHSVIASLAEGIVLQASDGSITETNKSAEQILGLSLDQMMGRTSIDPRWHSIHEDGTPFPGEEHPASVTLRTGKPQSNVIMGVHKPDGSLIWISINSQPVFQPGETTPSTVVTSFADITERKQAEEEIRNLAFYDSLTKLPNRRLLLDRFHLALSVSARSNQYGAVLFLDLDRFKTINDNIGHHLGDRLLIEVARRIHACVREMDTVARLGGDEFVILVAEIDANAQEASQKIALIAEKIRSALTLPYMINGHEYHSSPSIGVCLYHGDEEPAEDLLKHADMAMYHAKDSGRNTVRFFDPLMQQSVEKRAALEIDLRHAVSLQQLHLHYQIQLDNEHRPLGAEALLRWIHPSRGTVAPAEFIPLAEESMLILEIGQWVLESACRQLRLWEQHALTRDLTISVNVSAQQFAMPDFVGKVAAVLRKHRINPARLKLELTESVVLGDVHGTVEIMHALKGLGVGLSMDDFGTGYSSLSYLKILPLDQLKIDQSFVRDIASDPNDALLVQTIIDMARNFRLNVIAEGVETEAQLAFLKHHGCMAYQGYLFSRPVPLEEFEAMLGGV